MTFVSLCKDVWTVLGIRYPLYVIVMIFAGLVEGFALASVIPLLSAVGIGTTQSPESDGIAAKLATIVLSIFDIPASLNAIAGFVLVALFLSTILFLTQAYLGVRLQTTYVNAWQRRLISAAFSARLEYFHRHRHGNVVNAVVTETQRLGGALYQLGLLLTGVVHGLIFLAIAASLSVPITLTVLAGGAVLFLLTRPLVNRAYQIGTRISEANADFQTMVTDFVAGAKLLKATATERQAVSRLVGLADRLRTYSFTNAFDMQIAKGVFDFGAGAMVAVILLGSHLLLGADPAITLAVLVIFVRLMPKLSGIQQSLQSLSLSIPAVEVLYDIARSAEIAAESATESTLPDSLAHGPLGVRLQGLTVSHGDLPALRDVHLNIPAGSCVALVGRSGAGKSTLVDAILGLVPASGGTIEVNGHNLCELSVREFRRRVGYMTQDTVLFNGTIRDNIQWGGETRSDAILLDALTRSAANEFIGRLPNGLNTSIGNRGSMFSGGERQRLGLARALVVSPGLLILDEATNALDFETENLIATALYELKGKSTIIIISHNPSLIRLADRIHIIDNKTILESGTWNEFMADGSRFDEYWRSK